MWILYVIMTSVARPQTLFYLQEEDFIFEQKGSKLLKIVSIIMMIGGIVSAVFSVIAAILAGLGTAVMTQPEVSNAVDSALAANGYSGSTGPVMAVIWIAVVVSVVCAVVEIIAGVKGKKNWNNPAAAQGMMILGIVCAALSLVSNILFATGGLGVQIVSILSGMVLPVLYIVGTIQLKKQA